MKKYVKCVRSAFPVVGKEEKRFLKDFDSAVSEYMLLHPACTEKELILEFGEPEEISIEYFNSMDAERSFFLIKKSHYIKAAVVTMLFFLTLFFFLQSYLLCQARRKVMNTMITTESVRLSSDGDFSETSLLCDASPADKTVSGTKTILYKNSAGSTMWSITVSGTFSCVAGEGVFCTSVTGSARSYVSDWEVSFQTEKDGDRAVCTGTGRQYFGERLVCLFPRAVILSCDVYGNLF